MNGICWMIWDQLLLELEPLDGSTLTSSWPYAPPSVLLPTPPLLLCFLRLLLVAVVPLHTSVWPPPLGLSLWLIILAILTRSMLVRSRTGPLPLVADSHPGLLGYVSDSATSRDLAPPTQVLSSWCDDPGTRSDGGWDVNLLWCVPNLIRNLLDCPLCFTGDFPNLFGCSFSNFISSLDLILLSKT